MTRRKKITLISNLAIVCVLVGVGIAVFTADLTDVFIAVSAPIKTGKENTVAIAFVVEEPSESLDDIVNYLKNTKPNPTPATFFIGADWASSHPIEVQNLANDPLFEIGNHAQRNRSLAPLKEGDQLAEISTCQTRIRDLSKTNSFYKDESGATKVKTTEGVEMRVFLPPNGSFNKKTLKCAQKVGLKTVMYSIDATTVANNLAARPAAGDIELAAKRASGGDFVLLPLAAETLPALTHILFNYATRTTALTPVKISDAI